jgi:uncharacterized protein YggE
VSVLGQKVGKAVTTDNSQNYQPQPFMQGWRQWRWMRVQRLETLAAGEITITANASVSFLLE